MKSVPQKWDAMLIIPVGVRNIWKAGISIPVTNEVCRPNYVSLINKFIYIDSTCITQAITKSAYTHLPSVQRGNHLLIFSPSMRSSKYLIINYHSYFNFAYVPSRFHFQVYLSLYYEAWSIIWPRRSGPYDIINRYVSYLHDHDPTTCIYSLVIYGSILGQSREYKD